VSNKKHGAYLLLTYFIEDYQFVERNIVIAKVCRSKNVCIIKLGPVEKRSCFGGRQIYKIICQDVSKHRNRDKDHSVIFHCKEKTS
jgi:hypothetical protein